MEYAHQNLVGIRSIFAAITLKCSEHMFIRIIQVHRVRCSKIICMQKLDFAEYRKKLPGNQG